MFTGKQCGRTTSAAGRPDASFVTRAGAAYSVQVENLAQQLLRFHSNDLLALLPPVADDVPEDPCDTIKTRHAMYVPPKLVSLSL
jgi:hypothetical protein